MGSHSKKNTSRHLAKPASEKNVREEEKSLFSQEQENGNNVKEILVVIAAAIVLIIAMIVPSTGIVRLISFLIPLFMCGYEVFSDTINKLSGGNFLDESFLMSVSTVGAFVLREYPEGVAIMLFYRIGELLEDYAQARSRRKISELTELRPDMANVVSLAGTVSVNPSDVRVGTEIIVFPGERVPLDGIVLSGTSNLDMASLSGESVPVSVYEGNTVLSGAVNISSPLRIKTTSDYSDSTASRILALIEDAVDNKSVQESRIHKFAKIYTPVVVLLAVLIAILPSLISGNWETWINKALVFLVVSCPCALVISVPLTYFAGIGNASQHGILIKGSNYLEALSKAEIFVFDKTGTITEGRFSVQSIHTRGISDQVLLNFAAKAESLSKHPIASAIMQSADAKFIAESKVDNYREFPGRGIRAIVNGADIIVGNANFVNENCSGFQYPEESGTTVFVSINGKFRGYIILADKIKPGVFDALERLRTGKAKKLVLLTGDVQNISRKVASSLNFDMMRSELLPQDKVASVEYLMSNKNKDTTLVFVGDGVNDAPVLVRSDIGVAMGAMGSDAAVEAADIVIMDDDIMKVATASDIADFTVSVAKQNIILSIGVKVLIMLLGLLGVGGIWIAVFGDVGVLFLAVMNALRALGKKYE